MLFIIHYSRKVFLLKAYIDSVLDVAADGTVSVKNQKLTLIPYYAWNHRGANQMNVWFYQNLNVLDK